MRIGIDATWAATVGTGTGSYTEGLVRALVNQADHEIVLYFRPGDDLLNPLYTLPQANVRTVVVGGKGQIGRTILGLSRAIGRDALDVFHSPGYFLPVWKGPKVVTFHDVNMFLQWSTWWRPGMKVSWLSLCVQTLATSRLADLIMTDSHDACANIRRVLRISGPKVTVLYPGVDDRYFGPHDSVEAKKLRASHNLDDYLLFVSVLSPQKNLEGVIRAFAEIRRPSLKLAIVGREDGLYYRQIVAPLIADLGLTDSIEILGTVPASALPGLYAGALAFIFPSFAEGFGLPPLEAMACGTPVISSDRSSLPEILDDAALFVDPSSVRAISQAMDRVLADNKLHSCLAEAGRAQAAKFRWATTAKRALELYESVA